MTVVALDQQIAEALNAQPQEPQAVHHNRFCLNLICLRVSICGTIFIEGPFNPEVQH